MAEQLTKKESNPMAKEINAKIDMYEEEIAAHKKVGNIEIVNAIQKEVDNLRHELFKYL